MTHPLDSVKSPDARIRYRSLPDWVKALIEPAVAAHNAAQDQDPRFYVGISPRDVINTSIKLGGVAEMRRSAIQAIFARLRAEDMPYKDTCDQISEWFGCGGSLIMTALHPEVYKRRNVTRAALKAAKMAEAA